MDLREKPGKVQKILELFMRCRLIAVVIMVIALVTMVATRWQELLLQPLSASESLGTWLADNSGVAAMWSGSQYLVAAFVAMVVLFFVFGGVRAGVSAIVGSALYVGAIVALDGAQSMVPVFYAVFAVVSLVLLFVGKWGVGVGVFPFAVAWVFLTGLVIWLPDFTTKQYLLWAVLSAIGFSGTLSLSAVAGKLLGEGTPQAGALVRAAKKMVLPMVIASLLGICAIAFDMEKVAVSGALIGKIALTWLAFCAWYFVFLFPMMTFGPWERLRSKERRVQMKSSKKNSK